MKIAEIMPLLDKLTELDVNWGLDLRKKGVGRLWVDGLSQADERYHPVLSILTSFFERLNKEISGGIQSWSAEKDGATLMMYRVAQCKVVGYRTVERKKVVEVETEEIETDEEPIYDCTGVE